MHANAPIHTATHVAHNRPTGATLHLKVVEMPTVFQHEGVQPCPIEFTFRLSIDAGSLFKAEKVRLRVEAASGLPEFVVIEQRHDPDDQEFVYQLRSVTSLEEGLSLNDKLVEVLRKLGDTWTLHLSEHGRGLEAATRNTRIPGVSWLAISADPLDLMPSANP